MGTNFKIYKLMPISTPSFKEQIRSKDILDIFEENYNELLSFQKEYDFMIGIFIKFCPYCGEILA